MYKRESTINPDSFYQQSPPEIKSILSRLKITPYENIYEKSPIAQAIILYLFNSQINMDIYQDELWSEIIYTNEECTEMYVRLTSSTSAHVLSENANQKMLTDTSYTYEKINTEESSVSFIYKVIQDNTYNN